MSESLSHEHQSIEPAHQENLGSYPRQCSLTPPGQNSETSQEQNLGTIPGHLSRLSFIDDSDAENNQDNSPLVHQDRHTSTVYPDGPSSTVYPDRPSSTVYPDNYTVDTQGISPRGGEDRPPSVPQDNCVGFPGEPLLSPDPGTLEDSLEVQPFLPEAEMVRRTSRRSSRPGPASSRNSCRPGAAAWLRAFNPLKPCTQNKHSHVGKWCQKKQKNIDIIYYYY